MRLTNQFIGLLETQALQWLKFSESYYVHDKESSKKATYMHIFIIWSRTILAKRRNDQAI